MRISRGLAGWAPEASEIIKNLVKDQWKATNLFHEFCAGIYLKKANFKKIEGEVDVVLKILNNSKKIKNPGDKSLRIWAKN